MQAVKAASAAALRVPSRAAASAGVARACFALLYVASTLPPALVGDTTLVPELVRSVLLRH